MTRTRATARGPLVIALLLFVSGCADLRRAEDAFATGDLEQARGDWEELARRGFPEAEYRLGRAIARRQLGGPPTEARERLGRAFDLGHDAAALELARFHADPSHELFSEDSSVRWLEIAAELGSVNAERSLVLRRISQAGTDAEVSAALAELETLAEDGDLESHFRLGAIHEVGARGEPDFRGAALWYASAVEGGHSEAMVALAQLRLSGRGVERDDSAALQLLESSARTGNLNAASTLARVYGDPAFSEYDLQESKLWERRAEQLAQVRSIEPTMLAASPGGTPPLETVRRQAEAGNPSAALAQGRSFAAKIGSERGAREEAVRWFRVAARAGSREAQSELGRLLAPNRRGQLADPEVVRWLREAAKRGDAAALRRLGDLHAGRNLPDASSVEAAAHYLAASHAGDSGSLHLALQVIDRLSGAQTDAAYARSRELVQ